MKIIVVCSYGAIIVKIYNSFSCNFIFINKYNASYEMRIQCIFSETIVKILIIFYNLVVVRAHYINS